MHDSGIIIRRASPGDIAPLANLGGRTFCDAFGHLYSEADRQVFLKANHSPENYKALLGDTKAQIWVAAEGDKLLGFAQIGPNSLPCAPPRPQAIELKRLYIDRLFQGRGLGRKLLDAALDFAASSGAPEIVLSVYAKNWGAHKLYQAYGFAKIQDYLFKVGNHRDPEWIMLKPL